METKSVLINGVIIIALVLRKVFPGNQDLYDLCVFLAEWMRLLPAVLLLVGVVEAVEAQTVHSSGEHTEVGIVNGEPFVRYIDTGEVRIGGSRSWRLNNPGMIVASKFANEHGAIGGDGRFAIFPTAKDGAQALIALLKSNGYQVDAHGKPVTLKMAINKYAPPSENNTGAYINFISKFTGIWADALMSALSDEQIRVIAQAIQKYEGYRAGRITHYSNQGVLAYPPEKVYPGITIS